MVWLQFKAPLDTLYVWSTEAGCEPVTQIYLLVMKEIKSRKKELAVQLRREMLRCRFVSVISGVNNL